MDLSGRWKGQYTYGRGYPHGYIGRSEPFELYIEDNNGVITGTCIDEIVTSIPGNEATIEGSFKESFLSFVKRYKFQKVIDESNKSVLADDHEQTDGVHYVGHIHKKLFSRKIHISGEWQITSEFFDENNICYLHSVEGTWTMSKI